MQRLVPTAATNSGRRTETGLKLWTHVFNVSVSVKRRQFQRDHCKTLHCMSTLSVKHLQNIFLFLPAGEGQHAEGFSQRESVPV